MSSTDYHLMSKSNSATDRTPLVVDSNQPTAPSSSSQTNPPNPPSSAMADSHNNEAEQQGQNADADPPVPEQTAWIFSIVMIAISSAIAVATKLWISGIIAFGINWLVFLCYAWPKHTEKVYDFTGMITFLSVDLFSFIYHNAKDNTFDDPRSIVMFAMPLVWTLRLGIFLFRRILGEGGKDSRFDTVRNNFPRFFMLWTLQGVWAYLCMMPVLVVQSRADKEEDLNVLDFVGWGVWCIGYFIEILADHQKSAFKEDPSNRGKFCNVGLWSVSRHPNYFGEITLWWGLAIAACSVARDWDWFLFVSPLWTMILLIFMSGLPASEKAAERKYGKTEGYQEYKASTPVLIPFCFCWK